MGLIYLTFRKIHAFQNVKQCYFKVSVNTVLAPINMYRSRLHLLSFCHTCFEYKSNSANVIPTGVNGIMCGVQNKCLVRLENFNFTCIVFDGEKKTKFPFSYSQHSHQQLILKSPHPLRAHSQKRGKPAKPIISNEKFPRNPLLCSKIQLKYSSKEQHIK